VQADETPHRMLEGDEKTKWYLWGFSSKGACYFEYRDTRSGSVAQDVLKKSKCEVLLTDVFSGYAKAVADSNIYRGEQGTPPLRNAYCNAHARRKFDEAMNPFKEEGQFYLDQYKEIYRLERLAAGLSAEQVLELRSQMFPFFEKMQLQAQSQRDRYSAKSSLVVAINYFLNNYEGLTLFIKDAEVPVDNNAQERALRNPVIGRKTWYGTHSIKGAKTAAVLFSLVESCRLNSVNPRDYFKELAKDMVAKLPAYTPKEYSEKLKPL
jgi:hypothetical protein